MLFIIQKLSHCSSSSATKLTVVPKSGSMERELILFSFCFFCTCITFKIIYETSKFIRNSRQSDRKIYLYWNFLLHSVAKFEHVVLVLKLIFNPPPHKKIYNNVNKKKHKCPLTNNLFFFFIEKHFIFPTNFKQNLSISIEILALFHFTIFKIIAITHSIWDFSPS